MGFSKLPIMGKNVEITLKFAVNGQIKDTTFEVEPEKWSERRTTIKTSRKPLAIGQRPIERNTLQAYVLTFSGAKVSDHLQRIMAVEDALNATGDSLQETDIEVIIEITNPNDATVEKRIYTLCTLGDDLGTDAQDLEGNVEENFSITAKKRQLFINDQEITGTSTW